jgi:hypothetical protein
MPEKSGYWATALPAGNKIAWDSSVAMSRVDRVVMMVPPVENAEHGTPVCKWHHKSQMALKIGVIKRIPDDGQVHFGLIERTSACPVGNSRSKDTPLFRTYNETDLIGKKPRRLVPIMHIPGSDFLLPQSNCQT